MQRLLSRFGRLPIAPFAIPVMVCGPIWSRNILRLAYQDMLPWLLLLLGITAAMLVAFRFALKSWMRASLITMIWVGYLLYLEPLVHSVTENDWVLVAAAAVFGLLAWDISRRVPKDTGRLARANGMANLVLWIPALLSLANFTTQQVMLERGRPDPTRIFVPLTGKADETSPDVWHFVMDRYAGSTTLARAYGYDNSEFLGELRKRGFAVADDAYSNYQITPLSVASTLNASYLDRYNAKFGDKSDVVPFFYAIDRNAAFDFFKRQGYEIIFAGSWADLTVDNSMADRDINFRQASEVPRILIGHSLPGALGKMVKLPYTDGRWDQCLRAKYKFARLREVAAEKGRKLVFAHFLVPHPPYVLKADGSCQSFEEARANKRVDNYVGQVKFANRELLKLVDAILAGPRPATIVIHADEGPYPPQYAVDEPEHPQLPNDKDWFNGGPDVRRQKTSIIMAIRHADGKPTVAPRTPVNIYPIILNRSFNAHIPLKPDRTFMFPGGPDMTLLKDVSKDLY